MTKNEFQKFYLLFTKLVKQEVNREYCMNASAHLVDHCGGYELELRPTCIIWGEELALIQALASRYCHAFVCDFKEGLLTIR